MIAKQVIIEWNDRLKLGIPLVDRQHERLVDLTNILYIACLQSTETANHFFIKAAHDAIDYASYHFTTEEKMMIFLEYPGYQSHKKEHGEFVKEVMIQEKKFISDRFVPNRFVHFLKEWILSHIAVIDKAMVSYILGMKYHEKLLSFFPKPAR